MKKQPKPDPETCGCCKFFRQNDDDDMGYCHRSPPFPVVLMDEVIYVQPVSEAGEWCGEFARRLNS